MSNENQAKAIAQLSASIESLEKRNHELVDSHNHLSDKAANMKIQTGKTYQLPNKPHITARVVQVAGSNVRFTMHRGQVVLQDNKQSFGNHWTAVA